MLLARKWGNLQPSLCLEHRDSTEDTFETQRVACMGLDWGVHVRYYSRECDLDSRGENCGHKFYRPKYTCLQVGKISYFCNVVIKCSNERHKIWR